MTTAKLTLEEWLSERCGNAMAIAAGETGAERDWWLEEIEYFKQAVEALEEVSKLREALKRVEDALMVNLSFAEVYAEMRRLRAALDRIEIGTAEIIEACGGDWVLEAWDEENPDDFPLAVMRLMRDEQRKMRKEIAALKTGARADE